MRNMELCSDIVQCLVEFLFCVKYLSTFGSWVAFYSSLSFNLIQPNIE